MRLLKKIGWWFLGMITIMVALAYLIFFLNQDVLKDELVRKVNRGIQGRLQVAKLGLDLFTAFPKLTVNVKGVRLFEHKTAVTRTDSIPVLALDEVKISLNVKDLLQDEFLIEEVALDGGRFDLISYADSTLNLQNALATNVVDTATDENNIVLDLNRVGMENVHLHHHDEAANIYLATTVKTLETTISLKGDSLRSELQLDIQLDSLMIEEQRLLGQHSLTIDAGLQVDMQSIAIAITGGQLTFDLLSADLAGTYNHADSGYVDIVIAANHDDLREFAKIEMLDAEYLPDIRGGKLVLTTTIKGKTLGRLPVITTEASLSELHIHNTYGDVIEDSGFKLKFYSGTTADWHDGRLYIYEVDLNFASGGYLTGELGIVDFAHPRYKINWQLSESLADLDHIFHLPGIAEMSGTIRSQARLKGEVDLENKTISSPRGIFRMQFEECTARLRESGYQLSELNGQIFFNEGSLSIDNLTFNANGNELKVNSKIKNFLPYLLGNPVELETRLAVHTHSINTYTLLAFNPELQEQVNYQIDSVDLVVQGTFNSIDIDSFNIIPTGNLEVKNLTAKLAGIPLVNKMQGNIAIQPDILMLAGFAGYIGKSPLDFSMSLTNYDGYFQTDSLVNMAFSLDLESDELIAKDFFTINQEFLLPKSYEHEVLENVAFSTLLTTNNFELQKTGLVPEFGFQVTGLKFQTHFSPVKFREIAVFGLVQNNTIYLNSLFGKLGKSDVFVNGEFNNVLPTKDTISRPFKSRISINSQLLDLDELVKLSEADTDHLADDSGEVATNPFADDYPITDLSVNIGQLNYYGAVIKNLSGILKLEDHNIIKLDHVTLQAGEYGSFEFEGVFDASSHQEAILNSNIKIKDVDLSKLNVTYIQDGKEIRVGDHLAGIFNGEIDANVPVLQDFSFDLARLTGTIRAVVKNGALVNYGPLQEMSKYFKNKDLNNVYFADLMNTMVFDKGKMHLPFMTINTTLGTIMLMGYQTIDGEMEFDVQVPVKMVAGAVLNSLFASKKGDDGKADEISKGPKGKYVTVHIFGDPDGEYQFKIGKKHGVEPVDMGQ